MGGGNRVDLIELVLVDHIAEGRRPAVEFAFQSILRHAAVDLLCQLRGVVLRHSLQNRFQQDALRAFGNGLRGGHDPDAVSPQHGFVMGGVVAISGKAIQLPDENDIKRSAAALLDHPLEFRAVVCLRGICPVNVRPEDLNIILLRERFAFPELAVNGFLPLIVTSAERSTGVEKPGNALERGGGCGENEGQQISTGVRCRAPCGA